MKTSAAPLLQFRAVGKRFGGTQVVANLSLDVHAGEPIVLPGETGVGKFTLIKLLAGIHGSGCMPGMHLVTAANIGKDGGPNNRFDPDKGYRIEYCSI